MVSSKNGPSSGSGLSKIASDVEHAVVHQPFDRELVALDELLDEHAVVRLVALGADVGRRQQRAQPVKRRDQARSASSTRMTPRLPDKRQWLDDAGKPDAVGQRSRVGARVEPGTNHGTGRPAPRSARGSLACCARRRGRRRMPGQPERLVTPGGDDGRAVADSEHAVNRRSRRAASTIVGNRSASSWKRIGIAWSLPRDPRACGSGRSRTPDRRPRRSAASPNARV